jgi:hypothetical protein
MMTPISKALDEIKNRIPQEILELIFNNRNWASKKIPISIDEQILIKVIRHRVMVDCNLVGGIEMRVPMDGIPMEQTADYTVVFRVPKEKTQGRSIMSVLNLTFSDPHAISNFGTSSLSGNSAMLNLAQGLIDSHGAMPNASTARCQLIGENVVMVSELYLMPANCYLRCILANDSQLSHLQLRSYPYFSELCVRAVKAYIYNNHIIKLDMGEIRGGTSIGAFKTIIESYADQDELYREYLEKDWRRVAAMNDGETWERMLRSRVGGNR